MLARSYDCSSLQSRWLQECKAEGNASRCTKIRKLAQFETKNNCTQNFFKLLSMIVQWWLAPSPDSKRAAFESTSACSACACMGSAQVLLPKSKDMHVRLNSDSKLVLYVLSLR